MEQMSTGAVFVQTNAAHNEVIAFARAADGSLSTMGTYSTGGAGDDTPHLTSQGSVTLTRDRRHLLVTNVASGDVSVFALNDGTLELTKTVPVGPAPKSVAEHDGLVFVLTTGDAAIHGFRLVDGDLVPVDGGMHSLSTPDGAQIGFTPDGRALIATERGADKLSAFAVGMDGMLGEPRTIDSQGATPYGFAISTDGTLVVTEAFGAQKGAAAASSYRVDGDGITPRTASVGNMRSEICWAVIGNDGRFVFTTNFADGAVSRYRIDMRRLADSGGRDRRRHRGRQGRAPRRGPVGRRAIPLRDRHRPGRDRGMGGRRRRFAVGDRALERCPHDGRRSRRDLMQLESLYRVTFTTPESWSVTREGARRHRGAELPDRRGSCGGRALCQVPGGELPAPPRRRGARAGVPRCAGDRRRRLDPVPLGRAGSAHALRDAGAPRNDVPRDRRRAVPLAERPGLRRRG